MPADGSRYVAVVWTGTVSFVAALPDRGVLDVGRAEGSGLRVDHASVSRRHAELVIGDDVVIRDCGARNGVRVGGRRLAANESMAVGPGAIVELGDVSFVLQRADVAIEQPVPSTRTPLEAVVADPAMKAIYGLLDIVAETDVSVLILGETGTGKDVYARELHRRSKRAKAPFVALSCAALPDTMIEAELFGYEKGAFSGAVQAKQGQFEIADSGTVFLDELGEIPLTTQAKLLRVIEMRETTRLGSVRPKRIDVRIISATHRDLLQASRTGAFRADLFYRLNGFVVTIPSLRDRPADISALTDHFADAAARKLERPRPQCSEAARLALARHRWPGNVRELRSVVERAVLVARGGVIEPSHLALDEVRATGNAAGALWADVDELEKNRIIATLEAHAGNQTNAAKALGISRGTLLAKLDRYAIDRPRKGR